MRTLIDLLRDWMPEQRWFRGSGASELRHLGSYVLEHIGDDEDVYRIIVALIVDEQTLPGSGSVPAATIYQVPLVLREADSDASARGYLGSIQHDGASRTVIDGPHDPAFAAALLALVASEGQAGGETGDDVTRAFGLPMPGIQLGNFASSRVLDGEQSNTSIICEMRRDDEAATPIIMKVFRILADGDNPDVTLQTALASAGSRRVPAVVGNVSGMWLDPRVSDRPARGNLVFVQEFLPGVEDAWRAALRAGASGDDFLTPARTLGQATAEVHAVLRKVMPTVPTTPERVEAALAAMRTRLDATIAEVPALAEFRERALACFAAARDAEWPISQRIHGDYHLGQVLAVPGRNWVLLDFEGEPLSPLEVRNAPDCAVRDVAGMLRSFDYVSGSLTMTAGSEQAHDWAIAARKAFIEGYGEGLVEQGIEGKELRALLDERVCAAYEIDKALYEARYEALHRPDWLGIPMGAIERLLGERESAASNK